MTQKVKLLLIAPSFPPDTDGGGPTQSLKMIAQEAAATHVEVVVIAPPGRDLQRSLDHDEGLAGITVIRASGLRQVCRVWSLRHAQFDHAVVSSFWSPISLGIQLLRILGILRTADMVLTPRGQLNAGPLLTSRWKKVLALPVYRFVARRAVDRFVATSRSEQDAILRVLGREADLARQTSNAISFTPAPKGDSDQLAVGFISRIHPRKGLLQALQGLLHVTAPVSFRIAGGVQDTTYWESCRRTIQALDERENTSVAYVGQLERDEVEGLLGELDVMVLVSSGENFGHSIAEALQAGVRVVICKDTPWTPAIEDAPLAGTVCEYPLDAQQFGELMQEWATSTRADRERWRAAARKVFLESQTDDLPTVTHVILNPSGVVNS